MPTTMGGSDISAPGNITAGGNISGANLASGAFTPTAVAIANVASVTPAAAQWLRVGNVVTVSGNVAVDPSSTGTLTALSLTLPAGLTASAVAGTLGASDTSDNGQGGRIFYNDASSVRMEFTCGTSAAVKNWSYIYQFLVP